MTILPEKFHLHQRQNPGILYRAGNCGKDVPMSIAKRDVLELRRRMEKWFADYVNPDIDGVKEGVTGGGQLCSAGIYAEKVVRYAPDI